jgi:ankyrin repeat protein
MKNMKRCMLFSLTLLCGVGCQSETVYGMSTIVQKVKKLFLNRQLKTAIETGNLIEAAALLRQGADPNVTWRLLDRAIGAVDGWTLIPCSAHNASALVHALASPRTSHNYYGETRRIPQDNYDGRINSMMAEVLVEAGANVNAQVAETGVTPLMAATMNNLDNHLNHRIIGLLLDQGAATTINARTSFRSQSMFGQEGMFEEQLLASGSTSLHFAAARYTSEIVQLLISHGADINMWNSDAVTPLMAAIQYNSDDAVALTLIDSHADIFLKDNHGFNALMYATRSGRTAIAHRLIEVARGAHCVEEYINEQDDTGATALMLAVEGIHIDTVGLLLRTAELFANGANNVLRTNNDEESALDIARQAYDDAMQTAMEFSAEFAGEENRSIIIELKDKIRRLQGIINLLIPVAARFFVTAVAEEWPDCPLEVLEYVIAPSLIKTELQ